MDNQEATKNNEFLSKIMERYDFIESIIIFLLTNKILSINI